MRNTNAPSCTECHGIESRCLAPLSHQVESATMKDIDMQPYFLEEFSTVYFDVNWCSVWFEPDLQKCDIHEGLLFLQASIAVGLMFGSVDMDIL